jgi:hypothetical protein
VHKWRPAHQRAADTSAAGPDQAEHTPQENAEIGNKRAARHIAKEVSIINRLKARMIKTKGESNTVPAKTILTEAVSLCAPLILTVYPP